MQVPYYSPSGRNGIEPACLPPAPSPSIHVGRLSPLLWHNVHMYVSECGVCTDDVAKLPISSVRWQCTAAAASSHAALYSCNSAAAIIN